MVEESARERPRRSRFTLTLTLRDERGGEQLGGDWGR